MTLLSPLPDGSINLAAAYGTLPITRIEMPTVRRSIAKCKIPRVQIPGAIISMRYNNCTRGIIRSTKPKQFRNAITIDLGTSFKNINIKISSKNLQICGAVSSAHGREAIDWIVHHLEKIQKRLVYLREHSEDVAKVVEWMDTKLVGNPIIVPNPRCPNCSDVYEHHDFHFNPDCSGCQEFLDQHPFTRCLGGEHFWIPDTSIPMPELETFKCRFCRNFSKSNRKMRPASAEWLASMNEWLGKHQSENANHYQLQVHHELVSQTPPPDFDPEIVNFFMCLCPEYTIHENLMTHVKWITSLETVYTGNLEFPSITKAMVNYNYNLNFGIDRKKLSQMMNRRDGFFARFNPFIGNMVTIELPYEDDSTYRSKRRKNEHRCHTFLVYESGRVTQSGPNEDLMREAYIRFMNHIWELYPLISKPPEIRKIVIKLRKEERPSADSKDGESRMDGLSIEDGETDEHPQSEPE